MPYTPVPLRYRKGSAVILSIDSTDFAEGTGIVNLFGAGAGSSKFLTRNSGVISQSDDNENVLSTTSTATTDDDFDLAVFKIPQTLSGTMQVTIPGHMRSSTSPMGGTNIVTITVRKVVSGGGETDIASAASASFAWTNTSANDFFHLIAKVTIPKTQFKKGDILRMNVAYAITRTSGSGTLLGGYAYDPSNNNTPTFIIGTDGCLSTVLTFFVPFDIDL